jgi:hypothetical protein
MLFDQNNEVRVRVSTKSTVISKAKIMSYEDPVATQQKRDAKETSQESSSKGSRIEKTTCKRIGSR